MSKNRVLALVAALLIMTLGALAPSAWAQERVDLVVLLDSSQSMFPYYNQVVDFVISGALKEYMRFGDTFHLLSFSDITQVEIAQSLRTEDDVKSALARLYLLYPLGRSTDLIFALRNIYQYVSDLPEASSKHIILITDGMHSPLAGSPYADYSADAVRAEIERVVGKVKERGWTMRIVRVPFTTAGSTAGGAAASATGEATGAPGAGDYLSDVANALGVGVTDFDPDNAAGALDGSVALIRIDYPDDLGRVDSAFRLPLALSNPSAMDVNLELLSILLPDGRDILKDKIFVTIGAGKSASVNAPILLLDDLPEGVQSLSVEPRFADGTRISPARGQVRIELKRSILAAFFRNTVRAGLFFGLLALTLIALIFAFRYVRSVHRRADAPVVDAVIDSQATAASYRPRTGVLDAAASTLAGASRPDNRNAAALLAAAESSRHGSSNPASASLRAGSESVKAAHILEAARAESQGERPAGVALLAASSRQASERNTSDVLSSWSSGDTEATRRAAVLNLKAAEQQALRLAHASRPAYQYTSKTIRPGAARFEFHVYNQNTNIGRRNIGTLHAGGKKSIGGGSSDFLVFLLPVPRRIADIYYDGLNITIVPVRPEFFPDCDGPITDCLGQDVRVVNTRGKELIIHFKRYVPPLERLNRLLHCIETPGITTERNGEETEEQV
ncbi:MAG: VWA domain-containing protein [Spirochaetales bacterium]|nr:MAG: VWA domain-containing protein [Spirochaetales bacterium]